MKVTCPPKTMRRHVHGILASYEGEITTKLMASSEIAEVCMPPMAQLSSQMRRASPTLGRRI